MSKSKIQDRGGGARRVILLPLSDIPKTHMKPSSKPSTQSGVKASSFPEKTKAVDVALADHSPISTSSTKATSKSSNSTVKPNAPLKSASSTNTSQKSKNICPSQQHSTPSEAMLLAAKKHQEKIKRNQQKSNRKKRKFCNIENSSKDDSGHGRQQRRRRKTQTQAKEDSSLTVESLNSESANENKRRKKESRPCGDPIKLGKSYKTKDDRELRKEPSKQKIFERKYIYDQKPYRGQGGFKFRILHGPMVPNERKPRLDRIWGCENEFEARQRELDEKYQPWTA